MARQRRTPVVVGVGDIVNRSKKIEEAREPLDLILEAIHAALKDSGLSDSATKSLQADIDSIDIVRTWTWPYPNLPGLVAERLKVKPLHKHYSEHGGNQPCKLLDDAARRVSLGDSKVAIVTGGEALASLSACAAAKKLPPPGWTKVNEEVNSVFSPTTRALRLDVGAKHKLGNPIQIYPLYENAFRAHRGQSIPDNHDESAELYAEFARVAENNPHSWSYGSSAETKKNIGMISLILISPDPLLMNAFNTVNLASACVVTSTEHARNLGVPEDKWIYPLGGAGTQDSSEFWKRPTFWWSPAISRSLDAAIEISGLRKDEIDLFDFYSCFPIVPKLACHHLGLPFARGDKPVTLLGGLTSFGGAGNNYSMHAIAETVRQLRQGNGKTGLILANGGVVSYQAVVCLSRSPRRDGLPYPDLNPLPPLITDVQTPVFEDAAEGEATIETYTVEFNRDGSPLRGYVIGRLNANGHRFIANHGNEKTLQELCRSDVDPIGRIGSVQTDKEGRNLFTFVTDVAKL